MLISCVWCCEPTLQETTVNLYQKLKTIVACTGGSTAQASEASSNVELNGSDAEPSRPTLSQIAATFFKKCISSLVVLSYLSLTMGQSYAMDKVHPEVFSTTLKMHNSATVVPMDLNSPTGVTAISNLDNALDIESGGAGGGSPATSEESTGTTHSNQEPKDVEMNLAKVLFGNDKRKIHPLK